MQRLLSVFVTVVGALSQIKGELPRCLNKTRCYQSEHSPKNYEVNGYEIFVEFQDKEDFSLTCYKSDDIRVKTLLAANNPDLPVMKRLVEVKNVKIKSCTVPLNGSYQDALTAMNVTMTRTSTLFLSFLLANPKLDKHHMSGLQISTLVIIGQDEPVRPTENYLDGLLGLRTLKLRNVIPEPKALMLIPEFIEELHLEHARLPSAEQALGNGSAWIERLHSLRSLFLVESSATIAKIPGIFLTLPNITSLSNLTSLAVHHVPLDPSKLSGRLKNVSLKHLVLVSCGLNNLEDNLFEGANLTSLSLTYNNLTIADGVFSPLKWMNRLNLSYNNLNGGALVSILSPLANASLEMLNVNNNPLGSLCGDDAKSESQLPKTLRWLELNATRATRICSDWVENDALMHIDLSNNDVRYLTYDDLKMKRKVHEAAEVQLILTNNPKLHKIDVSSFDIQRCHNESLTLSEDLNNRTRVSVKLKLDPISCDCETYWLCEVFCDNNCSLLEFEIDIPCSTESLAPDCNTRLRYDIDQMLCQYSGFCLPECSCWKRPRDNATVVRCAGALPRQPRWPPSAPGWPLALHVAPGTLAVVPNVTLVELHSPNNNINSLDGMIIDENLLVLDLRNNTIQHISETAARKLNATAVGVNRSVFLAGNRLACTCSDAPSFQLLNQVVCDWHITQCADNSYVSEKIESELCTNYLLLPVLIGLATLILLSIAVSLLLPKIKSKLRKILFKYNMCLNWTLSAQDNVKDPDKTYDVFLSYTYDDLERLIELKNGLESRGYSTIEHCRDWQPSVPVLEQIRSSVLCARRTLLLVSDHFAKSKWALKEFHVAHAHAMERRTARVLIVRYNLNEPEKLPSDLQLYIKYHTYLDSDDDNFWYKLCSFMPPPKFKLVHD